MTNTLSIHILYIFDQYCEQFSMINIFQRTYIKFNMMGTYGGERMAVGNEFRNER